MHEGDGNEKTVHLYATETGQQLADFHRELDSRETERFANYIPLDIKSVFTWYMEQKGVENPERFIQQVPQIPQEVQAILLQDPTVQQMIKGAEDAKASRASHSVNQTPQKTPQEELESITKSQEATI